MSVLASASTLPAASNPGSLAESKVEMERHEVEKNVMEHHAASIHDTNADAIIETAPGQGEEESKVEKIAAGGSPFPPNHPMHPSQFSGDRFERKPMLVLLGAFCVMFCSFGWVNTIGIWQEYYASHQLRGYSQSTIAWIISCETFFMFFLGPFVGAVYDRTGPRYLILIGTFLHVFGLMMASISNHYYAFLLSQGICSPIGCSMLFFAAMTATLSWFWKWRALAFGGIAAGSSIGGVILPIMITNLIPQIGFAWTMRTCGFVMLGLLIIGNITISSRLPPTKKPFSFVQFVEPLKEVPYVLLNIGGLFGFIGIFIPIGYCVVYAGSIGMSPRLQGYVVPVLNSASFFGRTIPGALADKIGRFNMMIIMCCVTLIVVFAAWIPAKTNADVLVFAALYGFSSGAYVSIIGTLTAEITKDMSKIGLRNGLTFCIISIAALIGTPIGGQLLNADDGKFLGLQLFAGLTLVVGTLLITACRIKVGGFKIVKRV